MTPAHQEARPREGGRQGELSAYKVVKIDKRKTKWCSSFCGRELPAQCFYRSGAYLSGACRQCHRIEARDSYRRAYRNRPAFSSKERKRSRERLASDPVYRETNRQRLRKMRDKKAPQLSQNRATISSEVTI